MDAIWASPDVGTLREAVGEALIVFCVTFVCLVGVFKLAERSVDLELPVAGKREKGEVWDKRERSPVAPQHLAATWGEPHDERLPSARTRPESHSSSMQTKLPQNTTSAPLMKIKIKGSMSASRHSALCGAIDKMRRSASTDSDLSGATTPRPGERTADKSAKHATVKRAAVRRMLPAWHRLEEWPAGREASGRLTLRDSADPHAEGMRTVCRIVDGVLTVGIERRDAAGEETEEVVAEVPAEALAVALRRGRTNMFMIATIHKDKLFDEIFCFCDNSIRRNKWIAVFRRMGVAIFDVRD